MAVNLFECPFGDQPEPQLPNRFINSSSNDIYIIDYLDSFLEIPKLKLIRITNEPKQNKTKTICFTNRHGRVLMITEQYTSA